MKVLQRDNIYKLLEHYNVAVGVELGVDRGEYSETLNKTYNFKRFFSIDRWSDHHTTTHYFNTLKRLLKYNVITLRCTFEEALNLFDDNFFDFIYIDGNAKQGQESGTTFKEWYPKLKPGGVFAGHDYHPRWQKTVNAVDEFLLQANKKINLTLEDEFPSWWIIK